MALDLNNALDFAKLTSSTASGLLSAFGRDPSEWDILEASYNDIVFHVFQSQQDYKAALPRITDSGGRRKVQYRFPYVDGQALDDLGAQPETFEMEILIFGQRYKKALTKLFAELNKPQVGVLVHPVRGKINCAMESYRLVHEHSSRNAVMLQITFIQQSFIIASFGTIKEDKTTKGWIARALGAFQTIDSAISKVESTLIFTQSVKNSTTALLEDYKSFFSSTLGRMNNSFNDGGSADLPTLKPVNEGGTVGDDGTVYNSAAVVASQTEAFNAVPTSDIEAEDGVIDVLEAEKEVNTLRGKLDTAIAALEAGASGLGALEFYDDILDLKKTAVTMQQVLETAVASSRYKIVEYELPRLMSLREVAYANGLGPDSVEELEKLNPSLLSTNHIAEGTTVKVAVNS